MSQTHDRLLVRELWTKSIDTQLRLATFASRSRQLALAVVTVGVGAALLVIARGVASMDLTIAGRHVSIHPGVLVLGLAAVALAGFALIDRQHDAMLRGATRFTKDLEEKIVKPALGGDLPNGLGQAFSRDEKEERPHHRFRMLSVALPAVLALVVLVASNTKTSPRSAGVAAIPPLTDEIAEVTTTAPMPSAAPVQPMAAPAAPVYGKTVARTTAVAAKTGPAKAGEVAATAAVTGQPVASETAAAAPPPSKSAESVPSKPAEPAAAKPAEAASPPAEAPSSKAAEAPPAKPADPAPATP